VSEHPPPATPGGSDAAGRRETVAEFTIELVPPYLTIAGRAMTWRVRLDRTQLVVDGDWIELRNVVDPANEFLRISIASPADRGAVERVRTTVTSWCRRQLSDDAGGPVPPASAADAPPAAPPPAAPPEAPPEAAPEAPPEAAPEAAAEASTEAAAGERGPAGSRLRIWRPDPSPARRGPGIAASELDLRDPPAPAPALPDPPPPDPPNPPDSRPPGPELAEPDRVDPPAGPPPPICGPPVIEPGEHWLAFAPLPDTWALSRGELFEPEGGR